MSAEDYLPDCYEIELYEAYTTEFLSNPETKARIAEERHENMIENVKCPDCGGEMVLRSGQYGVFWGCKAFPACKGTRDNLGR